MPKYRYTAVDSSGNERAGTVDAQNHDLASIEVKGLGLFPTNIEIDERRARRKSGPRPKSASQTKTRKPVVIGAVVNQKGLTTFTRQLATLTQSGLPLLRSLEVLARQEQNVAFRWVLEQLAEEIRAGSTFSEGMEKHPKVFNRLYVNMVRAGEAGGVLDVVMNRLALFMEKARRIRGRIRSAMVYPIVILCVTVIILTLIMVVVVPQFEAMFEDVLRGAALPGLTQVVLDISRTIAGLFFSSPLIFLRTVVIFVGGFFLFRTVRRSRIGEMVFDRVAFYSPVVGDLSRKAAIARFSRTFGTLLSSGVPILQALQITRDTSPNSILRDAIDHVHDRVKEGEGVAGPLEQKRVFPAMVTSMIDVGEETGELNEMLNRIADTYEEEVDNAVSVLTANLEPMMIVFMAVVVGTIIVSLFLPIITIIENLG